MKIKQQIIFEVVKNDRTYAFLTETGCPLGESYDACFEVLQQIVALASQASDKAQRKPEGETNGSQE